MKNVVVVGVGNLGKRHLEGLLPSSNSMHIYCIDPLETSIKNAKETILSKELGDKQISFSTSFEKIPGTIDLAIIATNSKNRLGAVRELVMGSTVRNMILEKVLFADLNEYDEAEALFERYSVSAWVNCPRRLNERYQLLRKQLSGSGKIHMNVFGNKWGMGSNTVHFLDLFVFLANSKRIEVSASGLTRELFESKRTGYVEFIGTIHAFDEQGSTCCIHDLNGPESGIYISIFTDNHVFHIKENDEIISYNVASAQSKETELHRMEFQSQLTYKVADSIFWGHDVMLTSFKESGMIHRSLISSLIHFFNPETEAGSGSIAIT